MLYRRSGTLSRGRTVLFRSVWRRRSLLLGFLRRELGTRYAGTMGALWAFIQPVLLLAIYAFVFRLVFRVQLPDLGGNSYVTVVACALWPWMAFQEGVQRGTVAVVNNADLVRKVAFPRELLVMAAVAGSFTVHLAGFGVVLLALSLWGENLHLATLPLVLAGWAVLAVLALALALLTSGMQVVLKDVDHMLGPLFMLGFYATPVLYPMSMVPEAFAPWMGLNPMVHALEPLRAALLQGQWQIASLLGMALLALLLLWAGRWVFTRLSARFEDFL